jgi:hypothetical protein
MMDPNLKTVLDSIRPVLAAADATEEQREQFLYDLVREVYDYVKFDVYGPDDNSPERDRIGSIVGVAMPRIPGMNERR